MGRIRVNAVVDGIQVRKRGAVKLDQTTASRSGSGKRLKGFGSFSEAFSRLVRESVLKFSISHVSSAIQLFLGLVWRNSGSNCAAHIQAFGCSAFLPIDDIIDRSMGSR